MDQPDGTAVTTTCISWVALLDSAAVPATSAKVTRGVLGPPLLRRFAAVPFLLSIARNTSSSSGSNGIHSASMVSSICCSCCWKDARTTAKSTPARPQQTQRCHTTVGESEHAWSPTAQALRDASQAPAQGGLDYSWYMEPVL